MTLRIEEGMLNPYLLAAIVVLASYLLGSLNFGTICSKVFAKSDVREMGSGGAGATNYLRTVGGASTIIVVMGDLGKCALSVLVARWLFRDIAVLPAIYSSTYLSLDILAGFVAGFFCMLGHMFPLYFGFRGGKGVLTTAALILLFDWRVFAIAISVFILIVIITRYVSLGSIIAVFTAGALVWFYNRESPLVLYYTAIMALIWLVIVLMHRQNIARLIKGTESKVSMKRKEQ